jgi:hypothetical protein
VVDPAADGLHNAEAKAKAKAGAPEGKAAGAVGAGAAAAVEAGRAAGEFESEGLAPPAAPAPPAPTAPPAPAAPVTRLRALFDEAFVRRHRALLCGAAVIVGMHPDEVSE